MNIITITLNPAFDLHCTMATFRLHQENYVTHAVKHAGGKGINISRALSKFGIPNTAYCVMGRLDSEAFLSALSQDGIDCRPILTEGGIRENITVHAPDGETRISMESRCQEEALLEQVLACLKDDCESGTWVTFTGRLLQGISTAEAVEFLLKLKALGANLIVDCNSFSKEELLTINPFFIKPNEQEIGQLLNTKITTVEEAFEAAQTLCDEGLERVGISLGEQGFVYCDKKNGYHVKVPKITPVSTIGAGDSLIAGFAAGMAQGKRVEESLKLAAAFGTAACLTEGTNPPKPTTVQTLLKEIRIETISLPL